MKEIWADIEGYEGLYQVSNFGNVKSFIHCSDDAIIMKPKLTSAGYKSVMLYKNGVHKDYYVHRLVALTFLPNPENKPQVNHKDGDKTNNCLSNLEWVTCSENQIHAIINNLRKSSPMKGRTGKLNPQSKKILQYDHKGTYIQTWDSISDAARFYSCSLHSISACVLGVSHSSYGFMWKPYTDNFPKKIESLESIYKNNCPLRKGVHKKYFEIDQYTKSGVFVKRWDSIEEICESHNCYQVTHIVKNLNGSRKSAYGYIWKAVDE